MPFVETTMIVGYGADVKKRLATALTRSVRSVMNAPMDGVIVVFREVEATNWVRGGVSRTPGPALPAAIDVVQAYLAAEGAGDTAAIRDILAEGLTPQPPAEAIAYQGLTEALTDNGSLVFAEGTTPGGERILRRFHVLIGRIEEIVVWGGGG